MVTLSLRPSSFFSNLQFSLGSILSEGVYASPISASSKVNWVSPIDIAEVAVEALIYEKGLRDYLLAQDGQVVSSIGSDSDIGAILVVNVLGPSINTLNGADMLHLLAEHPQIKNKYVYSNNLNDDA